MFKLTAGVLYADADVAQLVEQLTRNEQVVRSNRVVGAKRPGGPLGERASGPSLFYMIRFERTVGVMFSGESAISPESNVRKRGNRG